MSIFRALGPAVGHTPPAEALRNGIGAFAALLITGIFVLSPLVDLSTGLFLIAPFGATSVLLFAVPNSPLAQPWSAVVGNTLAAIVGVAACLWIGDPALRIAVAVGGAIVVTILARAVHPPAGAVAMVAAMSPETVEAMGFTFALAPVAAGTLALVALAAVYARLTGRRYPFRQFHEPNTHGTEEPGALERMGLGEAELTAILERYRQSFNLGVEDLARLIGAAELQVASQEVGPLTAADIMSRDLITVGPETPLVEVAELFRRHRFTSLPVVAEDARFLGVIFQIHLISRVREDALRLDRGFVAAMRRLLDPARRQSVRAGDIMSSAGARVAPNAPLTVLLPLLAEGEADAVPVIENDRIAGIVTRTDAVAAMARLSMRRS